MTALIDQSPNQFIRNLRLQRAHDLLKKKAATSTEIAYRVGFGSPSYFTKCFHDHFGITPSEVTK
jgi:transcriptional regulator GlxA family with amidase domain